MPESAAAKARRVGAKMAESSDVGGGRKFLNMRVPPFAISRNPGATSGAQANVVTADSLEGSKGRSEAA